VGVRDRPGPGVEAGQLRRPDAANAPAESGGSALTGRDLRLVGRGGAEPPTFHFSGVRQGGHEGARAAVSRSGSTLGISANRAGGKGIETTTETTNVRAGRLCGLARAGASACPLEGEYSVCHCASPSSRQGRRAQSDTTSSRSVGRGRGRGDTRPLRTRNWTETGSSHVARLGGGQGRFGHIPDMVLSRLSRLMGAEPGLRGHIQTCMGGGTPAERGPGVKRSSAAGGRFAASALDSVRVSVHRT